MEARANCAGSSGAGPSGTTGCSAGAGPSGTNTDAGLAGVRVYLSQIKEWMLEVAADMVFIVVRTDCAWYKVRSVLPAYSAWFQPILKVARIAAHLLGVVQGAPRSSRLSFQDIVKLLSGLSAMMPAHISTRTELVRCLRPRHNAAPVACPALACATMLAAAG
jgi:DNA (cytosine-5)-methyltransferase 1